MESMTMTESRFANVGGKPAPRVFKYDPTEVEWQPYRY